MTADEQRLLGERLAAADSRGDWVRWLAAAGTADLVVRAALGGADAQPGLVPLVCAPRPSSARVAQRLRASLDSLSQGVGVFGPDRQAHATGTSASRCCWTCRRRWCGAGTPYAAFAEHIAERRAAPFLETEEQIRHGPWTAGEPVDLRAAARADGRQLEMRRTPMPDGGFVLTITRHDQAGAGRGACCARRRRCRRSAS